MNLLLDKRLHMKLIISIINSIPNDAKNKTILKCNMDVVLHCELFVNTSIIVIGLMECKEKFTEVLPKGRIHTFFTEYTCKTGHAYTFDTSDEIFTGSSIKAGSRCTFIYVDFTKGAGESSKTLTSAQENEYDYRV